MERMVPRGWRSIDPLTDNLSKTRLLHHNKEEVFLDNYGEKAEPRTTGSARKYLSNISILRLNHKGTMLISIHTLGLYADVRWQDPLMNIHAVTSNENCEDAVQTVDQGRFPLLVSVTREKRDTIAYLFKER